LSESDPRAVLATLREHEKDRGARRYERLERLGSGGMAVVYRAFDAKLRREVALKELRADLELEPEALARFRREAEAVGRLAHPNVVALHDALEQDGRLVLVMELVQGEPLSKLLASRRADTKTLLSIVEKAARGVHHAHERGIVHRDLKPSNVLVDRAFEPKVADFGIAHLGGERTTLTKTGALLGTPVYMAPEQVEGAASAVSAKTDVYALGVILYEILAGRVPHSGDTVVEIARRIAAEEPSPPRKINPAVSRDAETIVLSAMSKDPAKRYPSASDLADDLKRHLGGQAILARRPSALARALGWTKRHKALSAALGALVASALLGAGLATASALRFRARVGALLEKAESEPDPARAAELYREVKTLVPDHPAAEARAIAKRFEAERAEKARAARAFVEQANRARAELERIEGALAETRAAIAPLESGLATYAPPSKKLPLWDLERRVASLEREAAARRADREAALQGALAIDPSLPEAREAFAALHYEALEAAEASGDLPRSETERRLVLVHGGPAWAERLREEGSLVLDTRPSGAQVWIFRYEEGRDRRLLPRPFDLTNQRAAASAVNQRAAASAVNQRAAASAVVFGTSKPAEELDDDDEAGLELETGATNLLGTTPLASRTLPTGSYLLLLKKDGFRSVRYPLLVARGRTHTGVVSLYTDAEIGADFVYVPAGEFLAGGDPEGSLALPLDRHAFAADFFIAKFELTLEEYRAFLNSVLAREGVAAAQKRIPRRAEGANYLWTIEPGATEVQLEEHMDERCPALGLSWEDASAYCRFLTDAAHARGKRVTYRLPTGLEWEKAARGVDGRTFPWGNSFDWTFTKGGQSRPYQPGTAILPEAVGTFPADESPYGVRDMAGSVQEYCSDRVLNSDTLRLFRGGGFTQGDPVSFRIASRAAVGTFKPELKRGLRLVRELER
jgi:serine/threonine-protein kinase